MAAAKRPGRSNPAPHPQLINMRLLLLCCLALVAATATAQVPVGGRFTYDFLNLSRSARVSALGGHHIAVADDDIALAATNPALLNASMHQALSFNHAFHVAGISYGYFGAGHYAPKWNTTFQLGMQYIGYGDFVARDELGNEEGSFSAGEYAFQVGAAHPVYDRLQVGVNVRMVSSQLETYRSLGLLGDVAALYQDTAHNFSATILFKNIGTQLSSYREGNREPLPFEIQLGLSKKLTYLPFRFSIIYRYFDRWNLTYDDPNSSEDVFLLGEAPTEKSAASLWVDNFFRHFVFNGELLLGKQENFRLRVGYNHLSRQELSVDEYRSLAGFTFGAGIKISRFRLDYGRNTLHLGGSTNHLSIATNLREFKR